MPGVNTTLIPNDHICRFAQQIRDFAFSFVAPLSAYNNNVSQDFFVKLEFAQTSIINSAGCNCQLGLNK
jgi:hypothetical protein